MPINLVSTHPRSVTPNHEAYLLLGGLIERAGMRRAEFLARLAELGYSVGDDTFTNWGRPGRAFPRNWPLLRAMLSIVSDPALAQPCTAHEALRFGSLTGLPFDEIPALAQLFPADEFEQALLPYLPVRLAERVTVAGAAKRPARRKAS